MIGRIYGTVGSPVQIKGNAYDFGHAISAIEFSLDEGEHWTHYKTEGTNDYQNLTWSFAFTPQAPGFYVMRIRSINDCGEASPEAACVEIEVS